MNDNFVTYKNLKKTNGIMFFNNTYLSILNNLLNTHSLNFSRVIYKKHFIYTTTAAFSNRAVFLFQLPAHIFLRRHDFMLSAKILIYLEKEYIEKQCFLSFLYNR